MKSIFLLLIISVTTLFSFSQQEAATSEGKKVMLYPDGTWKTASESPVQKKSTLTHPELPKAKPSDLIINHTAITVSYNTTYNIANWVAYELTAEETVPLVKRIDNFIPDPLLKSASASIEDYKGSGYDRGHLAPAADMCFSYQTMAESFYLSNITPQNPSFNRGIWAKLEKQVRHWAIDNKAVYVVTGTVLSKGDFTIGSNKITVPRYHYKVILDYNDPDIKGIGFILPNSGSQESLQHFAVTIDSVEKVTGVDFFYQLPDNQQRDFEGNLDISLWSWTSTSSSSGEEKATASVQCEGKTKAGAHCKNKTLNSNGFCHLHQGQISATDSQLSPNKTTPKKRSSSVRCSATTKKGTQCSRRTLSNNGRCWQHGGD
jgi:endonuclease G